MKRFSLVAAALFSCLFAQSSQAQSLRFTTQNAQFVIEAATLSLSGSTGSQDLQTLAEPLVVGGSVSALEQGDNSAAWVLESGEQHYRIDVGTDGNALTVEIVAESPGQLPWPRSAAHPSISAYALPILGEGRFIAVDDAEWTAFLIEKYSGFDMSEASIPIWTELRDGTSLTWLLETPASTKMTFESLDQRLAVGFVQEFTPLSVDEPYRLRVEFGPDDPVAGAHLFRAYLAGIDGFRTLDEKIADNPDVALLAGAPHIYFHEKGPIKADDIVNWRRFVRRFGERRNQPGTLSAKIWAMMERDGRSEIDTFVDEAQGADGYVSRYARLTIARAFNDALPMTIDRQPHDPLPGGHDLPAEISWIADVRSGLLAEFPDNLAGAETWGGGLSVGTIQSIQESGIDVAWLGTDDWREAIWHPEAVDLARAEGYLIGVYDSYGSAHPTDLENSWMTAQLGDAIAHESGFRRQDGSLEAGFLGRGVYVNPLAIEDYAQGRMMAVVEAANLNSLFIDVDAVGIAFEDYTEGRKASKIDVIDGYRKRLAYSVNDLGMVTGSEGGTWLFAQDLAFGHGLTTPPFGWMDRRFKREKDSEYYLGGYWPPEALPIYFKPTPIPNVMARILYAPEHKIPLFQIALHDSMIVTHHWEYGSLKPAGQRDVVGLTQILYQFPPLYHLSSETIERDLPTIAQYHKAFSPLHKQLFNQQMMGFRVLTEDRLVQQTSFADGTTITVNFGPDPWISDVGLRIDPQGVSVAGPTGETIFVMETLEP